MTPELIAEQIMANESVMSAVRHCDSFAIELVIAQAIHDERERCAAIAHEIGEEIKNDGNAIMGRPSSVAFTVERKIMEN